MGPEGDWEALAEIYGRLLWAAFLITGLACLLRQLWRTKP